MSVPGPRVDVVAPANRLLLLDGHSLAYRAFYALPAENFSTKTGQNTNAVYGFTSMLVNVLRDEVPTHVAVAFDKSRQTFRLEEYADYKAKRNKTPDEFGSQLPLIRRVLDALRIQHLSMDGYEADDIIATLVTEALADGMEVLILTGDRDSAGKLWSKLNPVCVNSGVTRVVTGRRGRTLVTFNEHAHLDGVPDVLTYR